MNLAVTSKTRNPLINRNFALLWSGQTISQLGDLAFDTTIILWIGTILAKSRSDAPLLGFSVGPIDTIFTVAGILMLLGGLSSFRTLSRLSNSAP